MDLKPYSIAYIEDEDATRENYVKFLKRYFKEVYSAEDGEAGYQLYLEKRPQIMIIDINMPKMNGLELLKKIRESDIATRIIMLTAHIDRESLLSAGEMMLTKYLVKPVNREDLKNALHLVVEELQKFEIKDKKTLQLNENYLWKYESYQLFYLDEEISLTDKERDVLHYMFENLNSNLSYDDIILAVWDSFEDDKHSALRTIIKNLRKKLPENTIENVFGVGYKVEIK